MFGWSRGGGGIRSDWYDADSAMDLDFVNGRYFDGSRSYSTFDAWAAAAAATFTRESVALKRDATGKYAAVASGAPRLDYTNGLLIEGAQTNKVDTQKYLASVTTNFDLASPSIVDDTDALIAAGLLDLTVDGGVFEYNNETGGVITIGMSTITGNAYPHSLTLMARMLSGTAVVRLTATDNSAISASEYTLYRYDNMTPSGTNSGMFIKVSATSRIRFFLASLIQRSFSAHYPAITDVASTTTQPSEIFTQLLAGQPVGAVVITAKAARGTLGTQTLWQWDDGTADNRLSIYRDSSGDLRCVSIVEGVEQVNIVAGAIANLQLFQVKFSWKKDDFAVEINGTPVGADTSGDVPADLTTIRRGSNSAGSNVWEGHIQRERLLLTLNQYVSQSGNDSWSGLTADEPKATIAAALADLSAGGTMWVKAGEVWELGAALAPEHQITVRRYGDGDNPVFSSTSTIDPGDWSEDATHSGVYLADVTHAVAMAMNPAQPANTGHPALYAEIDGEWMPLYWVKDGADIAATRAEVAATPYSFTLHVQGSTEPDPDDEVAGDYSDFRYYVNLNGTDPATVGMHHAEWHRSIEMPDDSTLIGISWGRGAEKDACTMRPGGSHTDCVAIDVPVHGGVGLVRRIANYTATARTNGTGAWVWYRANSGAASTTIDAVVDGFAVDGFAKGFYAHGSGGAYPVINSMTVKNGTAENGDDIVVHQQSEPSVAEPALIENVVATNMVNIARMDDGTIRNLTWTGAAAGGSEGIRMVGDVSVVDSALVFSGTGNNLYSNATAVYEDDDTEFTLTLTNTTITGDPDRPTEGREGQVVVVE